MIKRFISLALVAFSFLSFAPAASAQHMGGYAYCNGYYRVGNCSGPVYTGPTQQQPHVVVVQPQQRVIVAQPQQQHVVVVQQQPQVQLIPVQGQPGMFMFGGNQHRCPALTGWTGGVIGLAIGAAIGNSSTLNGQKLTLPGAAAGALAGTQIACDSVRQNVVASVPHQGQHSGRICAAGKTWKRLDWPGHPQHGTEACLPSESEIQAQKQSMNAASTSERVQNQTQFAAQQNSCAPGKTRKTLDWPGHPQHGQTGCLPSDQQIEADKRALVSH